MRSLYIFLPVIVFVSCIKEKETNIALKLTNNTSHIIELIPYKNGSVFNEGRILLPPNSFHQYPTNSIRGILAGPVIFPPYLDMADSVIVIFDASKKITHFLLSNVPAFPSKYYLRTSERNLGNIKSYNSVISLNNKYRRKFDVEYLFSNQDYLDVQ